MVCTSFMQKKSIQRFTFQCPRDKKEICLLHYSTYRDSLGFGLFEIKYFSQILTYLYLLTPEKFEKDWKISTFASFSYSIKQLTVFIPNNCSNGSLTVFWQAYCSIWIFICFCFRPYLYDTGDTYEKPFFSVLTKMLLEINRYAYQQLSCYLVISTHNNRPLR